MNNPEILDDLFHEAVNAIDAGDINKLQLLLEEHPILVRERLDSPGAWLRDKAGNALDGFFKQPYLLWFVAEDPIRNGKLPDNIAEVANVIIDAAKREAAESLQEQLDYALRLVAWSVVARKCNVQIKLIDVLIDAGATPNGMSNDALVNGNFEAAEHLVQRGDKLTLGTALCLGYWDEAILLAQSATAEEKQFSLVLAALNGRAEALAKLIPFGVDVNAPSANLYSHGTPFHHAVYSGSLDAVKVLAEAGAKLNTKDTVYHGTPLGWAQYGMDNAKSEDEKKKYEEIAAYIRQSLARGIVNNMISEGLLQKEQSARAIEIIEKGMKM